MSAVHIIMSSTNDESTSGVASISEVESMRESTTGCPNKFIDNDVFMALLQDKGEEMNSAGTVHGAISDGAFYYKDLYKLAKLLLDNLSSGGFIKGPKNITNWRRGIAKHILSRRVWKSSGDIGVDDAGGAFHLSQEKVVDMICAKWPPSEVQIPLEPTVNDKICLIGILLSEEHSLDYDIILGNYISTGSRVDIDNPAMRMKEAWARIVVPFNNNEYIVHNPRLWDTAKEKPGFHELNPNDPSSFIIMRDGAWLSKLYNNIVSVYRVSFEKYTKGTGGGPGDPADYSDWENRPDVTFDRYSDGKLYLTWLYMRDKEVGFKLCAKYEDIPEGLDGEQTTNRFPTQQTSSSKKRSQSPVGGIQVSMENMTTALQAVASKLLKDDDDDDKTLDQLEKVDRLRKSYQELPENTEGERLAKRRRLEFLDKFEARLLSK